MTDEQKAWHKYGQDLTAWYLEEMAQVASHLCGSVSGLSTSGPHNPPPPPPGDEG